VFPVSGFLLALRILSQLFAVLCICSRLWTAQAFSDLKRSLLFLAAFQRCFPLYEPFLKSSLSKRWFMLRSMEHGF
jgi:hypothetical protein